MFPFVFLFKTLCFAELGVWFLKGNIQWIPRLLTLFLCLLSFDLELVVMPAMHASPNESVLLPHNLTLFFCSRIHGVCQLYRVARHSTMRVIARCSCGQNGCMQVVKCQYILGLIACVYIHCSGAWSACSISYRRLLLYSHTVLPQCNSLQSSASVMPARHWQR